MAETTWLPGLVAIQPLQGLTFALVAADLHAGSCAMVTWRQRHWLSMVRLALAYPTALLSAEPQASMEFAQPKLRGLGWQFIRRAAGLVWHLAGIRRAEDTMRFYALRLQEAGMIKSSQQKTIANGTDCPFSNDLRRELKRKYTRRGDFQCH